MNPDIELLMDLHARTNGLYHVITFAPWASRTSEHVMDQLLILDTINESIEHPVQRGIDQDIQHAKEMARGRNIVALQGSLERISEGIDRAINSYVEVLERYYPKTADRPSNRPFLSDEVY